jgi:ABC-type polysaccharide/polyol phosphate export permease
MFLAPTIYPTPDITTASTVWQKGLYWLHTLNPVSHYIQAIDALIEKGSFHMDTGFWVATVISFLVLAIGWRFFHICEPLLAERL